MWENDNLDPFKFSYSFANKKLSKSLRAYFISKFNEPRVCEIISGWNIMTQMNNPEHTKVGKGQHKELLGPVKFS